MKRSAVVSLWVFMPVMCCGLRMNAVSSPPHAGESSPPWTSHKYSGVDVVKQSSGSGIQTRDYTSEAAPRYETNVLQACSAQPTRCDQFGVQLHQQEHLEQSWITHCEWFHKLPGAEAERLHRRISNAYHTEFDKFAKRADNDWANAVTTREQSAQAHQPTHNYLPPPSKFILHTFCKLIFRDFYAPKGRQIFNARIDKWMFRKGSSLMGSFMARYFQKYRVDGQGSLMSDYAYDHFNSLLTKSDVDIALVLPIEPTPDSWLELWTQFQNRIQGQSYIHLFPHPSPIPGAIGFNIKANIVHKALDGSFVKSAPETIDLSVYGSRVDFDAARTRHHTLDASLQSFRSRICNKASGSISPREFDRFISNVKAIKPDQLSSTRAILMAVGAIEMFHHDVLNARRIQVNFLDPKIHMETFLLMYLFHFTFMFFRDDAPAVSGSPNWRSHALVLYERFQGNGKFQGKGVIRFEERSCVSPVAEVRAVSDLATIENIWLDKNKFYFDFFNRDQNFVSTI